jgi:hypothetical protein
MQPVFTQASPKLPRSMIATFMPLPASFTARAGQDWPVPITIAS